MIRLTFNSETEPEIHLFSKSNILLGADLNHVDLTIPGNSIQPIHLKIVEQNGLLILINFANDPFTLINNQPFGKKILNSGDIILVDQTTILFENLKNASDANEDRSLSMPHNFPSNDNGKKDLLETNLPLYAPFPLSFEQEVEVLKNDELEKKSIDSFLKETPTALKEATLAESQSLSQSSPTSNDIINAKIEPKKTKSLKDDYLKDLDDENQKGTKSFDHTAETNQLNQAWRWIFLFIFCVVAISAGIGTIIYFSMTDKTEAQETKATQAVADIAMALTYAQLNHSRPYNRNWSDVDFIKNNLQEILPQTFSYASQIDAQGQFNCCPYSLRIYTSSDLSHFLLITQPAPSLFYWLIPQSIIVVDSHLMELRTLKDVRGLNRLLSNPDPLEGLNGKEITALVKQGKLIRLSSLATDSGQQDFAPPKNLAWVRPGVENYIYNAPRYYRLGQRLTQKAINLSTSKGSSQDVAVLKQEVKNFSELDHIILYSDQGKKSAHLMRQGLMMFAPSNKILFGYLLFNAQGKIHQVHLLKDEEESREIAQSNYSKENEAIAYQPHDGMENLNEIGNSKSEHRTIDLNHPIYIHLQSLISSREQELKPLMSALIKLVKEELQLPRIQFQVEFQNLSHSYLMADAKHKQALKGSIEMLYHQHQDIPTEQFLDFINVLHLDQLIQHEGSALALLDENCQQNMEFLLAQIEISQTLAELDNLVHVASDWLYFDYIKDPQELIKYQNLLRNRLLEELESFLLTQKKNYIAKIEDKEILYHLLSQERLIKPEERNFFLEEFEILLSSQIQYPKGISSPHNH